MRRMLTHTQSNHGTTLQRGVLLFGLVIALVLVMCGVARAATGEINDGDDYTNSRYVVVSFYHGFNSEFRIGDSSYFSTYDPWYALGYADEVAWDLGSGDGTKDVYMQFRDGPEDTYFDKCDDSIKLDTYAPSTTARDDATSDPSKTVNVTLSASDSYSGSGVDRTEYSFNAGVSWTEYSTYSPIRVTNWNQTLYYRSVDKAGNVEDAHSKTYRVDLTGPACYVRSNTVKRGRMGYINYSSYDYYSPKTDTTITVTTLTGAKKLTLHSGFQKKGSRHWDFRVRLRTGKYRLTIKGVDLAGNNQSHTGHAFLRVK